MSKSRIEIEVFNSPARVVWRRVFRCWKSIPLLSLILRIAASASIRNVGWKAKTISPLAITLLVFESILWIRVVVIVWVLVVIVPFFVTFTVLPIELIVSFTAFDTVLVYSASLLLVVASLETRHLLLRWNLLIWWASAHDRNTCWIRVLLEFSELLKLSSLPIIVLHKLLLWKSHRVLLVEEWLLHGLHDPRVVWRLFAVALLISFLISIVWIILHVIRLHVVDLMSKLVYVWLEMTSHLLLTEVIHSNLIIFILRLYWRISKLLIIFVSALFTFIFSVVVIFKSLPAVDHFHLFLATVFEGGVVLEVGVDWLRERSKMHLVFRVEARSGVTIEVEVLLGLLWV